MPRPITILGIVAGVLVSLGASPAGAQQQVNVTVAATPNPVAPGGCARISADVRDELNRQLTDNGVPLQWNSYDYATSNGTDFEWRSTPSGESELCAKAGAGAVSTQVSATIKGMAYRGTTVVSVGVQQAGSPQGSPTAVAPATVPAQPYVPAPAQASTPPASAPPVQASTPPAQGYAPPAPASTPPASAPPVQASTPPAQGYAPPAPAYAPPGQAATPPPTYATNSPAAAQPAPAAPAPPPQAQAQAQPVKGAGGFFKKIGSHIKQKAADVKTETAQNLTAAATQVVDTTFQTGSRLVASTTAEVSNTARMSIGGVGRQLMLAPQRGGANADNLALAIASGRAVLLEMRFTSGTDVLEPSARELVQRLAAELRTAMAATPSVKFVIEGHVDSVPNINAQVLSEYRAAAVKAALHSNGVDANRLMALGYGTSRPLQAGGPPTARIEIVRQ